MVRDSEGMGGLMRVCRREARGFETWSKTAREKRRSGWWE